MKLINEMEEQKAGGSDGMKKSESELADFSAEIYGFFSDIFSGDLSSFPVNKTRVSNCLFLREKCYCIVPMHVDQNSLIGWPQIHCSQLKFVVSYLLSANVGHREWFLNLWWINRILLPLVSKYQSQEFQCFSVY